MQSWFRIWGVFQKTGYKKMKAPLRFTPRKIEFNFEDQCHRNKNRTTTVFVNIFLHSCCLALKCSQVCLHCCQSRKHIANCFVQENKIAGNSNAQMQCWLGIWAMLQETVYRKSGLRCSLFHVRLN